MGTQRMDWRNSLPFFLAQRKVFWAFVSASAILGAATSFPFRQTSSSGAITAEASGDLELVHGSGSAADQRIELAQQSLVQDVAVIAPLAKRVPASAVLAMLANSLPPGVTISELSLGTQNSEVSINFTLAAQGETGAASFISALKGEAMFEKVHAISGISREGNQCHSQVQMMLRAPHEESGPLFSDSRQMPAPAADSMADNDRLQRDLDMLETVLPAKSSIDLVEKQIVQLAAANSLQLSTMKSLPSHERFGCVDEPIEISISGSFNGFYSFLLQLESLPRLKDLSQLEMRDSIEHNGDMQAALRVEVFSKLRQG